MADEFPGRKTYPRVQVYETEQLKQDYDGVEIIDVRSLLEFDTLHINKAQHIPLNSRQFIDKIKQLQNNDLPLVFYCNGHTCYKSYKAAKKARKAGINNVFAYDAGVFDWARAYPDSATLLGQTPIDPDKLISKSDFKKYLLEPKEFNAKITDKSIILDIREPIQRGLLELYPYRQESIAMAEPQKLRKFLMAVKKSGRPLMVYDEVGKQVRWLQYYLQDLGIENYYFLKGGVKNFFKSLRN
jgi:rhodanese-related sulfurtransferase